MKTAAAALNGIIPILATPFTADGSIDFEALQRLIDAAIADGVQALALFGLAGEYYKLSDRERETVTKLSLRHSAGRVPVIVSVPEHATHLAVQQARHAVDAGAGAVMVIPPFFLNPPTDATLEHIRTLARAIAPAPLIVQYSPLQTGRTLDLQFFLAAQRECPNFTHVKVDLLPSGPLIERLREASGGCLRSLVGYMGLHLPHDSDRGVAGCMPTVSLAFAFVHLWRLLAEKASGEARALHAELLPLLNFMMQSIEMLIACEKELLVLRGILPGASCREPAYHLDAAERAEIAGHARRLARWLPRFS